MKNDNEARREIGASVKIDCTSLDEAIEKANRLVELLREASSIIDSLSHGSRSET